MSEKDNDLWTLSSWIMISSYRNRVMIALGNKLKTPSTLSRETGIKINHISRVLSELKKHGLIICINEDAAKGRLYQATDIGFEAMQKAKMLDEVE